MKTTRRVTLVLACALALMAGALIFGTATAALAAPGEEARAAPEGPASAARADAAGRAAAMMSVAIAVSIASGMLGAGFAVGKVGSAAMGAVSERPEVTARALLFVAIGEGIAILGLVGGLLLLQRLGPLLETL
ncbi:MAG: ATP synthase subunit C [Planctomycetota bacterium]